MSYTDKRTGEYYPDPELSSQFQGKGAAYVESMVGRISRYVPYLLRWDSITHRPIMILIGHPTSYPDSAWTFDKWDGLRQFTNATLRTRVRKPSPPERMISRSHIDAYFETRGLLGLEFDEDYPLFERERNKQL